MHGCKIYDCKAKACVQCFLGVSIMQLEAEGISQDLLNNSKSMSASQTRCLKQHLFFPMVKSTCISPLWQFQCLWIPVLIFSGYGVTLFRQQQVSRESIERCGECWSHIEWILVSFVKFQKNSIDLQWEKCRGRTTSHCWLLSSLRTWPGKCRRIKKIFGTDWHIKITCLGLRRFQLPKTKLGGKSACSQTKLSKPWNISRFCFCSRWQLSHPNGNRMWTNTWEQHFRFFYYK